MPGALNANERVLKTIEEAVRAGGFIRYRKEYSPLKWRFKHYRHPCTFWGRTMSEAVKEFLKAEANIKARRHHGL